MPKDQERFRIVLLLNSLHVPAWQKTIITFIQKHSLLCISLIVLNESKAKKPAFPFLVYKALRKIDRTLFKTSADPFEIENLDIEGIPVLSITPKQTRFSDEIVSTDLANIDAANPDIIIRFGFRILKGEILTISKYGVWSLHHGDAAVNRGGPPAFWEVVNQEPLTGVTLQVLTKELDGGKVIDKAFIKTDLTSFNRNQSLLYWTGVELFCSCLNRFARSPSITVYKEETDLGFYSHKLYKDPKNWQSLLIFFSFWFRRIKHFVTRIFFSEQWMLQFRTTKKGWERALLKYQVLIPPKGTDWADPFVIYRNNHYYVFFEEFKLSRKKAHISCLMLDETGQLTGKPFKVLEESYHLSYPFLLTLDDDLYMMPESAFGNNVWLYKCKDFPKHWERFKLLLPEVELYDPTLFLHENTWYLFGTKKPFPGTSPHQYLYLYYCDNLFEGKWKEHPKNPVQRDSRGARPAGKIFWHEGKLIRPGQLSIPRYGYGITFNHILKLSKTEYEEQPIDTITPAWHSSILGVHTFNSCGEITFIDTQIKRRKIL